MRWIRVWENHNKFALVDDGALRAFVTPTMEGKWLLQYNAGPGNVRKYGGVLEKVGVFDTLKEAQAMGKLIAAAQNP